MKYLKSKAKIEQISKQNLNNLTKYSFNYQRMHFDNKINTYYVTLGLSKKGKNLVVILCSANQPFSRIRQKSMSQQRKLVKIVKLNKLEARDEIPRLIKKYKSVNIKTVKTIDWRDINNGS